MAIYLGIMTRPAVNRQDTFKLHVRRKGWDKLLWIMNIIYIQHGGLIVSGNINMRDGIADQKFELAYYKALLMPKRIIVFSKCSSTKMIKPASES